MRNLILAALLVFAGPVIGNEIHLNGRNTVILSDDIGLNSTDLFVAAVAGKRIMLPLDQTLYIVVASPGGTYGSAVQIATMMAQLPNTKMFCRYCASAAGMIFAVFPKPNRLISKNSEVVMHEMYMDNVTANQVMQKIKLVDLIIASEEFNKTMRSVIGISRKEYEAKIIGTEWHVIGADLIKLKLADELVTISCDRYMTMLAPKTCSN